LAIEDEYEFELAAVQVALTRYEVTPQEYASRRAEIAARAYLRLAEAHQRFLGRNNLSGSRRRGTATRRQRCLRKSTDLARGDHRVRSWIPYETPTPLVPVSARPSWPGGTGR